MLHINNELAEKIAEEIKTGAKISVLSRKYGIFNTPAIHMMLRERGIDYYRLQVEMGAKYIRSGQRPSQFVSPETEQKILAGVKEGKTIYTLSNEFSINHKRMKQIIEKNGINYSALRRSFVKEPDSETEQKIVNEVKGGATLMFTCRKYSCSLNSVTKILNKHGIKYKDMIMERTNRRTTIATQAEGAIGSNHENERTEQRKKAAEEMIAYLKEKTRLLGYVPGKKEMLSDSRYDYMRYYRQFGSLNNALKQAGLLDFNKARTRQRSAIVSRALQEADLINNEITKLTGDNNEGQQALILLKKISGDLKKLSIWVKNRSHGQPKEDIQPDSTDNGPMTLPVKANTLPTEGGESKIA